MEPSHIAELVGLLQSVMSDAMGDSAGGTLGLIGILTLVAKYSVDLLRTGVVQAVLSALEKMLGLKPGRLQWARWSPSTRTWVSLVQSFLLALLSGLAVSTWPTALIGALVAAFGTKGLHDSRLLPGRRPTVYEPSLSRGASLGTRPPEFR